MARRDTREALLEAGVELFLQGGYDFTGTSTILERARVPRGSFYHHFADKRDFALAVATHYYDRHLPFMDSFLADESMDPLARLRAYFHGLRGTFKKQQWRGGCLLALLSQELADRDDKARDTLASLFGRWRHGIASCLREAQARKQVDPDVDVEALAAFLLDGWEGALIQMKLRKSGAPLDGFIRMAFEHVLPGG